MVIRNGQSVHIISYTLFESWVQPDIHPQSPVSRGREYDLPESFQHLLQITQH